MNQNQESIVMAAKMAVIESACGICSLPEEQLLKRLEELYLTGFTSGGKALQAILKDVTCELSKIVLAHLKGNPELLKESLDDFCQRHVEFVPVKNSHVTHQPFPTTPTKGETHEPIRTDRQGRQH